MTSAAAAAASIEALWVFDIAKMTPAKLFQSLFLGWALARLLVRLFSKILRLSTGTAHLN
jgi:hypothetical protein